MPVSVMFCEPLDAEGGCVLNIMASPLDKDKSSKLRSYLVDTISLNKCNHSTVASAAICALNDFGVKKEVVISFDTDNAAYMVKAYKTALKALSPNSIHVTCLTHIMNLTGKAFRKTLWGGEHLHEVFLTGFLHGRWKEKGGGLRSLKTSGTTASMAPNPIGSRWNSRYMAGV